MILVYHVANGGTRDPAWMVATVWNQEVKDGMEWPWKLVFGSDRWGCD